MEEKAVQQIQSTENWIIEEKKNKDFYRKKRK